MRYGILLAGAIGLLLLLDVGQRIHMITMGYEIEHLLKVRRDLERQNKELVLEKETLSSPERIEKIALGSLKMKFPEDGQIVFVGESGPDDKAPAPDSDIKLVRN